MKLIKSSYIYLLLFLAIPAFLKAQEEIVNSKEKDFHISPETNFNDVDTSLINKQLSKAKQFLFKEHLDSAKLTIKPLIQKLSEKNILDSSQGLEAQFLLASVSELNNSRGEALEQLFALIETCKEKEEWLTLSRIYLVTELAYEFLNKPERCLYYFNQCKALIEKHNLAITYPRFCVRYSTYHRIWGDKDSSYYYATEALRTAGTWYKEQNGNFNKEKYEDLTPEYATAHSIIGGFHDNKGELEKAKFHYEQTKLIWQKAGNDYDVSWAFLRLNWFHRSQNLNKIALLYNDSSLIYGNKVFDEWGIQGKGLKSYILLERAKLFKLLNRQDSAFHFQKQGYEAKIDVINSRNHLYATEIEARHTDQQKALKIDQQNEQLAKEQKLRLGLLGVLAVFLLLVLGLVYFYLQIRKANNKNKIQAEELKALDKVKSKFFANISHELRTPLTLILGPLSYILDNPNEWEKENIQKQLLVMQRNGKSLMELIEEILDLSKLEANKLELQEESTPVVQFFEYLFFVFEPQFQSQGLDYDLILEINEDLNILMDRKKIEKVLNNFLSNAIKFTPKGGKITMKVSETNEQLNIQVSDTGKGIHPKDLSHIFERFYQSKQADQKLYGGTGIGLALVNEFAQLMGGRAYAESTLGSGSHFFFEIPKKEVTRKSIINITEEIIPIEEEIYSIGNDFTIMVVEDNTDMREFICQLLQKKYNKILLAKNGAEGLELLKEHGTDIHLIVSDVMMPEVDGLTMVKEIKSKPEWAGIPVVMLTALAAERDKLTALTIGVDDYLTKPFSVPEMLIRVQNLLFNYHQRLEWKNSAEFQSQQATILEENTSQAKTNIKDKEWVDELTRFVEDSLRESSLDVESIAAAFFLSPRHLNRKLKAITGLSPAKFIKEVRLQVARKKLESGTAISVTEVALDIGFENMSTFSSTFKNRFGKSPSAYLLITN